MRFCVDVTVEDFLKTPDELIARYKRCGINAVDLYVGGRADFAPLHLTDRARTILLDAGFDVGAIAVPVGHPSPVPPNEVDYDEARKQLPDTWDFRVRSDGQYEYYSAELTDAMIGDTLMRVKEYARLGFARFFMDDDLRSANLSPRVGGCFCDKCLKAFGWTKGRDALLADHDALLRWTSFQSERVTRLMRGMREYVSEPGIMIMFNGDERHGVAPRDIAKIPGVQIRVGEEHFFDESASSVRGRLDNFLGVSTHLFRVGEGVETYSETTVCDPGPYLPYKQTTPEHEIAKARLALVSGVRNIYWMCTKHWDAIAEANAELVHLQAESAGARAWPVHIARGDVTDAFSLYADTTAVSLGLPAAGVYADEAAGGEALVIDKTLLARPEWQKAAEKYEKVLAPSELAGAKLNCPRAEADSPVCAAWIPSRARVAVFNPLETAQKVRVAGAEKTVDAGGAAVFTL